MNARVCLVLTALRVLIKSILTPVYANLDLMVKTVRTVSVYESNCFSENQGFTKYFPIVYVSTVYGESVFLLNCFCYKDVHKFQKPNSSFFGLVNQAC
jgi:hypothetical protein